MCEHQDRTCSGKSCRCECMNCMFPVEFDDWEDLEDEPTTDELLKMEEAMK